MKKLKQLLAAVLVLIIALNTPVCMETAAAKQPQMRRRIPRPVDSITIQEPSADSPENAESSSFNGSLENVANSPSDGLAENAESSLPLGSPEESANSPSIGLPEESANNSSVGASQDSESSS